ncbi:MAG: cytochrome-c peroxidase [Bdellovibrionota bacterium]
MKSRYDLISIIVFLGSIAFSQDITTKYSSEPIDPLPLNIGPFDQKKVELGRKLFHEPKLSKNNSVSCVSCHNLSTSGADNKSISVGINGALGGINTPTVFNSRYNFKQFWDGRANSLEDQIDGPIQNDKEMGSKWSDVLEKIQADAVYVKFFLEVYQTSPSPENIKDAIATFERTLVTSNSKFDRYLRGDKVVLNEVEKLGYQKFKSYGCIACHQGMNVGGNMFQTMGVMGNYFKDRGTELTSSDLGRYNVTKQESDKFVFRVPSLRNVELTAPYFHDGSAKDLRTAVTVMSKYQLGRKISRTDTDTIVAFLKTLTGENEYHIKSPETQKVNNQ